MTLALRFVATNYDSSIEICWRYTLNLRRSKKDTKFGAKGQFQHLWTGQSLVRTSGFGTSWELAALRPDEVFLGPDDGSQLG